MMNLRRAFTSKQPRPSTTHEAASAAASRGKSNGTGKARGFDASHLPPSPTFPLGSQMHPSHPSHGQYQPGHEPRASVSSVPSIGRTTGVGLRPRVPVQPTMHSRGTILLGTHLIEDEESRRLSEMAFLT